MLLAMRSVSDVTVKAWIQIRWTEVGAITSTQEVDTRPWHVIFCDLINPHSTSLNWILPSDAALLTATISLRVLRLNMSQLWTLQVQRHNATLPPCGTS